MSVTELPKPLPGENETSKPVGAVTKKVAVRLEVEKLNDWVLVEAVPTQAEIVPVTVPAVMVGGTVTVIVPVAVTVPQPFVSVTV